MGGGAKDTLLRDLAMGSTARTGGLMELALKKVNMHILEMEDVLFHLNSAVMMPERPKGASSSQGAAQPSQDRISGIQALAVAFKQFEFDPRKRMLIAGHTDTSGEPAMNFELSRQRADNVLHLLEGKRDAWAEVSRKRHREFDPEAAVLIKEDEDLTIRAQRRHSLWTASLQAARSASGIASRSDAATMFSTLAKRSRW